MQEFMYRALEDGSYCITGYTGDEADVVIPDTYGREPVTIIGDGVFSGHKEIRSIRLPDTVTDMGEFVFDGCENLRRIELPRELCSLWGYTFVRAGIEEITLPDKLVTVPPFAFKDCKNLRKVVCGKGLKKVYSWAFGGCDSLTEFIHEPETQVSELAFAAKELNT